LSKIPTLSVKLAKDLYFGKEVMSCCTVCGSGFHVLPEQALKDLKKYLLQLTVPHLITNPLEFELVWKNCIESIGKLAKYCV